jgi:hypothetical protein
MEGHRLVSILGLGGEEGHARGLSADRPRQRRFVAASQNRMVLSQSVAIQRPLLIERSILRKGLSGTLEFNETLP